MSLEHFSRGDLRTVVPVLVLGVVGAGVALRYYRVAFPEASIDFKISRPEIEQRAATFVHERGFDLTPYRRVTLFHYDETAKTYLERELGLAEANRLMASEINVWWWEVRFFKPPMKEELHVWLSPGGQVVGFTHIIEEKAAGARLEEPRAQNVAAFFLHNHLGLDPYDYTLVEHSVKKRPNRLDYFFTWERKNFKAAAAAYRIFVAVQGDQVGAVVPLLKVPEQWQRDYQRLRSRNEALETAASLFHIPLLVGILFVLIPRFRQQRIIWKPILWLGGIVGGLYVADAINSLPLLSEDFPTSTPYSVFVVETLLTRLALSVFVALAIAILSGSGGVIYRESAPDKVALPHLFTLSGLRTKEFFTSTLVGYALAAVQIGFVVVFYIVGRHFGVWSPTDIKYNNYLGTTLPWTYPLTAGLLAATREEFAFRLFAISFLKKYLKSTWLAVVIPAFVWGFLHSDYPQQPAWIRGVEVGLIGLVYGLVFLRFGILATLVAHYTADAALMGLFLLRSNSLYFLLTGGLVVDGVLIPLAIAGALYWQHRRFAAESALFNVSLAITPLTPAEVPLEATLPARLAPAPETAAPESVYAPLPSRRRWVAVFVGLVGLALWGLLPAEQPLDFLRWHNRARDAESIADRFLRDKDINVVGWRRATEVETNFQPDAAEYIRRRAGVKKINELWSTRLRTAAASWRVRYFRPLQKEEQLVFVAPDGGVIGHDHLIEENAPGANLTPEEARQRAADYLAQAYQLNVAGWKLAESTLEKRDARTDHFLSWEDTQPALAECYVRAEVNVRGDEVGGYRPVLKVPEEFERELAKPRIQVSILVAGISLLIVWLLIAGARLLPRHNFRWRLYIGLALLLAGMYVLTALDGLRTFATDYDTSIPWRSYVFQRASSVALETIGIAVLAALLALALDVFYVSAVRRVPRLPTRPPSRWPCHRDAITVGLATTLLFQGLETAYTYLAQRFPAPQTAWPVSLGPALDTYFPGLNAGINAVEIALLSLALIGIAVGVLKRYFRSPLRRAAAVTLILLFLAAMTAVGVSEFLQLWGQSLLYAVLLALAIRYFFRYNLLSYMVAFTLIPLAPQVLFYWRQPSPLLRANAVVAPLVAFAFLLGSVTLLQRTGRPSTPNP